MLPDPGSIDQSKQNTPDIQALLDGITGSPRNLRYDRPIVIQQRIQQSRLTRIRLSYDGPRHAIADPVAKTKRRQQTSRSLNRLTDQVIQLRPVGKFNIFLGKIKLEFYQRGKTDQPFPQITQCPGKSTPDSMKRSMRRSGSVRSNKIGHGFSLGQIQFPIQKRTLGKLPRPRQSKTLA